MYNWYMQASRWTFGLATIDILDDNLFSKV
jgi:hypothetical protein